MHSHQQTSHVSTHGDTSSYYRTTATSPLMPLTSTPVHSAALSNGTRPYDDIESEDDLDREDIAFPDAGRIKQLKF